MTKTKLKKKTKDELIEIAETLWKILAEQDKEITTFLQFKSAREEEIRHEVCENIKFHSIYCHINGESYFKIHPSVLGEIERGEI